MNNGDTADLALNVIRQRLRKSKDIRREREAARMRGARRHGTGLRRDATALISSAVLRSTRIVVEEFP